jgi:VRR-NUC domain.
MTPEGKIKEKIKIVLETYREQGLLYYYMSVPVGYGRSTLDYLGFICGYGFAIEAKAEGKKPSPRQEGIIEAIERSGASVFVIDGIAGLAAFNDWCQLRITAYRSNR